MTTNIGANGVKTLNEAHPLAIPYNGLGGAGRVVNVKPPCQVGRPWSLQTMGSNSRHYDKNRPFSVIRIEPPPKPTKPQTFRQKMVTQFGAFRFIQLVLSLIVIAFITALVAFDEQNRLYTIWLTQVPLFSIISVMSQLLSPKCSISNTCLDLVLGSLFLAESFVIVSFYLFIWAVEYWTYQSQFFLPVSSSASILCLILSITYWATGCSSACCHCLERNILSNKPRSLSTVQLLGRDSIVI